MKIVDCQIHSKAFPALKSRQESSGWKAPHASIQPTSKLIYSEPSKPLLTTAQHLLVRESSGASHRSSDNDLDLAGANAPMVRDGWFERGL